MVFLSLKCFCLPFWAKQYKIYIILYNLHIYIAMVFCDIFARQNGYNIINSI